MRAILLIILICLVYEVDAFAYIEPTVAGYLYQIAFIVFNGIFILMFVAPMRKIRSLLRGLISKLPFLKKS